MPLPNLAADSKHPWTDSDSEDEDPFYAPLFGAAKLRQSQRRAEMLGFGDIYIIK